MSRVDVHLPGECQDLLQAGEEDCPMRRGVQCLDRGEYRLELLKEGFGCSSVAGGALATKQDGAVYGAHPRGVC
jgi:hypothetical protein